ncbi:MAG: DUF6907 domain-containing protein [Acidimicrobiales bacterium]
MTSLEDYGWGDDRPCPGWCESLDHHLAERLARRTDHFWHKGTVHEVLTEDETTNLQPVTAQVYRSQHVVVDERGFNTRPVEVCVDYAGTFSPANARRLAAILVELASAAEAAGSGEAWDRPDGSAGESSV